MGSYTYNEKTQIIEDNILKENVLTGSQTLYVKL